ncbi:MAG TPA: S8 family serine peptidase [Pyrinomonadaceae bacterium]|nr:S8 family serine peptidase [Pyrinomonadaceae bacterium]
MQTRAATKVSLARVLGVLAALAFAFAYTPYLPPGKAQLKTTTTVAAGGARVDPLLVKYFATSAAGATAPAVITYRSRPAAADFTRLQSIGIKGGFALKELPMVIARLNAAQLSVLQTQPGVRSVYANRIMKTFTNESRRFIGVPQLWADDEVTRANQQHPGVPVSGKGIGIGYIDTGADATHNDLKFGSTILQNVIQPMANANVGDAGLVLGIGVNPFDNLYDLAGFYAPTYLEDQRQSDIESGHGTHGAAVAAGSGAQSGNFYGGVAPGAHLVVVNSGNEVGLPLVGLLGAYDYLLLYQYRYNIRVINNSWGDSLSPAGIDPDNPINIATREAHDRNITVVFAAGNGIGGVGDAPNAINPYSTMPWTISVAAGYKRGLGTPTSFSSRGENDGDGVDVAGQPADPFARPNLRPDITAPGIDIKSARMKGAGITNTAGVYLGNDSTTIPPAYLPFYTTSQGTSFACPHVSGVVALMLSANPRLTPDEVVTILRETATPMPYRERVVGAGYVDARNAVRRAMNLAAVDHPAVLIPPPGSPEIIDPEGDQVLETGMGARAVTDAQDIITGDFSYDAAAGQIVYALTVKDLAQRVPNNRWSMSSKFGDRDPVYVSVAVDELGTFYGEFGQIIPDPDTGIGSYTAADDTVDSVAVDGNRIVVRLSVAKVKALLGGLDVVGMTSTATEALAQITIGTSFTGGGLFATDTGSGRDFKVE